MYRFFLALRYLLSRPINLLGMAGVAVSVWALILVVSIFSGFLAEVRAHVHAANADLSIIALPRTASYSELAEIVVRDPNVAACAPRLLWFGMLHAFGKTAELAPRIDPLAAPGVESPFVTLIGIDPEAESEVTGFRQWLTNVENPALRADLEHPLAPRHGLPAILLSARRVAAEYPAPGGGYAIPPAATVKITGTDPATLDFGGAEPIEQRFALAGAYATRHHQFDSSSCFVHIGALRALLPAPVPDPVTEIVVRCKNPLLNIATARRLERTLNAALEPRFGHIRAYTWQALNQQILGPVEHQRSLMKLVLLVITVVAAFLMLATLSMMVTEKIHDIGVLAAMGATRAGILQVFLVCGLAIVAAGAAAGVAVGCISSIYLDAFNDWLRAAFGIDLFPTRIYNLDHVPHELDPVWILQVVAMALGLGVLVAGIPAWRASRHDPLASLRIE